MKTNTAALLVPPTPSVSETNDIRDAKPPVEVPNDWAWVWWTLALALLAAGAVAGWRWWCRRRARAVVIPAVPAHVRAREKLRQALAALQDPKLFCSKVSDAIRVYLEERFSFRAPERTTEEFIYELQGTPLLNAEQKLSLGQFLESCDLVKFAQHEPPEAELRQLHDAALRLIDETQYDRIQAPVDSPPQPPENAAQPVTQGTETR